MNEETFEAVMETVCDLCHWPFVCGEVALDEKCAGICTKAPAPAAVWKSCAIPPALPTSDGGTQE